jgi:Zn-dependent protease with chaperone function
MDFFAAQAAARRRRRWLLAGFAAVVCFVGALPFAFAFLPVDLDTLAILGLLWAGSMLFPAWTTSRVLDQGGMGVAEMLGAHAVHPDTTDLSRQRLYNVVEEMALASGMSVPYVYLLPRDDSINAMAAGNEAADAAVFLSRGALERLDRDQLQALVAHEFSHIQNGDMTTNTRMVAWMAGLTGLYSTGLWLLESDCSGSSRGSWAGQVGMRQYDINILGLVFAVPMVIAGSMGRFFASLLQSAACRQHERLADASAVQFTRNPDALKRVLLAASRAAKFIPSEHTRPRAAFAHLWFIQPGSRWLRTHPTLEERILAVHPGFPVSSIDAAADRAWEAGEQYRLASLLAAGDGPHGEARRKFDVLEMLPYLALEATPDFVVGKVGHADGEDLARGEALRAALPEAVSRCVASPSHARALTVAILAGSDDARWDRQIAVVERELGGTVRMEVESMREDACSIALHLRLPAIEVLASSLRGLAPAAQHALLTALELMEREDGLSELFECCLNLLVRHGLADDGRGSLSARYGTLWHSGEALRTLLSIVAMHGAPDDAAARDAAYRAGMDSVAGAGSPAIALPPNWPVALDAALDKLARLEPLAKRRVVAALTATVAHDGRLNLSEAELLRAICGVLRCPLPPLMPEVQPAGA